MAGLTTRPACRHCRKANVNRPRGLCWTCFYVPGVRDLYPSTSKYARRGLGSYYATAPLPEPTAAGPGTAEKMAVIEARAAAGQRLWHPLDAGWEANAVAADRFLDLIGGGDGDEE